VDKHFLEFWGNFPTGAVKAPMQLDNMAKGMGEGLSVSEDLKAMFKKCCDLDHPPEETAHFETWNKVSEDFQKSFKDYLSLTDMVTRDEHLRLAKKFEDLEKKAADQEETLKHLRMLLVARGADQGEVFRGFQDSIEKQGEHLQQAVETMGEMMGQFFKK
jgi:uncharacterized coiled-coil protein SlyX